MWSSFMEKLRPADIIGFVVIVFGFALLYCGIDHIVGGAVIAVTTYYFVSTKRDVNKENN